MNRLGRVLRNKSKGQKIHTYLSPSDKKKITKPKKKEVENKIRGPSTRPTPPNTVSICTRYHSTTCLVG